MTLPARAPSKPSLPLLPWPRSTRPRGVTPDPRCVRPPWFSNPARTRHRLLGRLHTLAPKIPLVTGWVDRSKAISHLRRAVALAPEDLYNQVYLADALLQHQPEKSAEAREILRKVLQRKPDPARVVEDERALAEARLLLK